MTQREVHPLLGKVITAVSLFSGAGGGSIGLLYAHVLELLALDYWDVAQKAFEENFKGERFVPFWRADVSLITPIDLLRRLGMDLEELCILLLSPPCQGFSIARGKLNPLDSRNALFLDGVSLIEGIRPKCFIIENVPGIDDPRNTPIFNEIKYQIQEILDPFYDVKCFKLLALNHHTPQLRFRLIFIGYLKKYGVTPTPPLPNYAERENLRMKDIAPEITAIKVGQSKKILKASSKYMNTITASDGLTVYSNGVASRLTVDQNKRFATFPDWYQVPSGISSRDAHKLFGNSIPPMFMKDIANHILVEVGPHF